MIQPTLPFNLPDVLPQAIFRAYDIRGIVEEQLNPEIYYALGLAIGTLSLEQHQKTIIVGRDGRLTSPAYTQAVISGLMATGCEVVDIGQVPSPVLYFATHYWPYKTGVMVTASHNPSNYNGLKIVLNGKTLNAGAIQDLYHQIQAKRFVKGQGRYREQPIVAEYIDYIIKSVHLKKPLKIVLDCGNGVGAVTAPSLYRALGCDVIELYCEVDGRFPNHHPDPVVPENLNDLIAAVKTHHADCGIALDGDADRLGFVTNQGEIIWPDRVLMYLVKDVLQHHPGAPVIFDVKCTNQLARVIEEAGGVPMMWQTGHSILKAKMLEEKAPIAGELSGHLFFNDERWFGFDDGVYVGARLLELLSREYETSSQVFQALPNLLNTPEMKVTIPDGNPHAFMEKLVKHAQFDQATVFTIDGLRVDYGYGWGLVRASNTTPALTLRFEADTPEHLAHIQAIFKSQLLSLNSTLSIPF